MQLSFQLPITLSSLKQSHMPFLNVFRRVYYSFDKGHVPIHAPRHYQPIQFPRIRIRIRNRNRNPV